MYDIGLGFCKLFLWCLALDLRVVNEDTCALNNSYTSQTKVDSSKAVGVISICSIARSRVKTAYSMFLGLMMKHHLVQIRPVHVRAAF